MVKESWVCRVITEWSTGFVCRTCREYYAHLHWSGCWDAEHRRPPPTPIGRYISGFQLSQSLRFRRFCLQGASTYIGAGLFRGRRSASPDSNWRILLTSPLPGFSFPKFKIPRLSSTLLFAECVCNFYASKGLPVAMSKGLPVAMSKGLPVAMTPINDANHRWFLRCLSAVL